LPKAGPGVGDGVAEGEADGAGEPAVSASAGAERAHIAKLPSATSVLNFTCNLASRKRRTYPASVCYTVTTSCVRALKEASMWRVRRSFVLRNV